MTECHLTPNKPFKVFAIDLNWRSPSIACVAAIDVFKMENTKFLFDKKITTARKIAVPGLPTLLQRGALYANMPHWMQTFIICLECNQRCCC